MLDKIRSNRSIKHFIAYSMSFIGCAFIITGMGPLIPYMSEKAGRFQTDYSSFFFWRAVAFIISGFLIKKLEKIVSLHTILIWSSILSWILLTVFCYVQSVFAQNAIILVASIACSLLEIAVNISIIVSHAGKNLQFWLQMNHGMFGIGGLLGPFLVYTFQTDSFMVMGIFIALTAIPYCFLASPELQSHQGQQAAERKQKKIIERPISNRIQVLMCLLFLFYVGLEHSLSGWIPTYAVIKGVSSKSQATIFTSIFWFTITISRFAMACLPGKASDKLKICIWSSLGVLALTVVMIKLGIYYPSILFSSIGLGALYGPMFPLKFSSPSQYGMQITVSQSANMMIAASMGEATISMLIGYLMGLTTPDMLFYSLIIISFLYIYTVKELTKQFVGLSEQYQSRLLVSKEIELIDLPIIKTQSSELQTNYSWSPVKHQKKPLNNPED